jgi:thioredoxin-related protein
MSNLHKRVELLSNIAIIIVAILLGSILVNRYLLPASPKPEVVEEMRIKPGMKLSLAGVEWEQSDQTLLLVLSTNCHFCTDSAPFYQRLTQPPSVRGKVRIVAVLPQSTDEALKYLNDHGIAVDDIRQAAPVAVHASATPTLILVDRTGSVIESWVGKLSAEKEAEVMNRFQGNRSGG